MPAKNLGKHATDFPSFSHCFAQVFVGVCKTVASYLLLACIDQQKILLILLFAF
jgi:hypothetical protein